MILEEETFVAYGYYSGELSFHSHKPVISACDNCGNVGILEKKHSASVCRSCAFRGLRHFGHKHTEETKAKMSAAQHGAKNHNFGKHPTKETRDKWRAIRKGENNPNWKGGKRAAKARSHATRDRKLGYIVLMPVKESEEGHHVTDKYVIGIPTEVHRMFSGYKTQKHRTLVLQWLKVNDSKKYITVLSVLKRI